MGCLPYPAGAVGRYQPPLARFQRRGPERDAEQLPELVLDVVAFARVVRLQEARYRRLDRGVSFQAGAAWASPSAGQPGPSRTLPAGAVGGSRPKVRVELARAVRGRRLVGTAPGAASAWRWRSSRSDPAP